MDKRAKDGLASHIATVRTEKAKATFCRTAPNGATMELSYELDELAADLSATSLQEGIAAICETEIEIMRQELTKLGEELASQLSDEGQDINLGRKWHDHDERVWEDTHSEFIVKGSSYHSREALSIPTHAAESRLVRAIIESAIGQREQSIRILYATILGDAQAKRSGLPKAQLS